MNVEGYISIAEMEIEQLQEDISQVVNHVTVRIIENAVQNRKDAIESVREKYLATK